MKKGVAEPKMAFFIAHTSYYLEIPSDKTALWDLP
jgi:hypothetical protein